MYIYDIPQEQEVFTQYGGKRAARQSMEQLLFTQVMPGIIMIVSITPFPNILG